MTEPEETLYGLSWDDCLILGYLFFVSSSIRAKIRPVVDRFVPCNLDFRRRQRQIDDIERICVTALGFGVELRRATYAHERTAAWVLWAKFYDPSCYESLASEWQRLKHIPDGRARRRDQLDFLDECRNLTPPDPSLEYRNSNAELIELRRRITTINFPKAKCWVWLSESNDDVLYGLIDE